MKKATVIKVFLALILIVCLVLLGWRLYQYRQGEQIYSQAADLVQMPDLEKIVQPTPSAQESTQPPEPQVTGDAQVQVTTTPEVQVTATPEAEPTPVYVDPYADALQNMDFAALREKNEDVLGWIVIPGTKLSYPLVQGEDNDYYLDHTWRKNYNSVGAIFMECKCSADFSDYNTIIYGHRMNNRSMFGILLNYKNQSYWEEHPRIYITDDNGSHVYEIFSAHEVELESPIYWLGVTAQEHRQAFIDFSVERSVIDTGIVPTVDDRFVTLSTCTGSGHATRWVVQAVKVTE